MELVYSWGRSDPKALSALKRSAAIVTIGSFISEIGVHSFELGLVS
jgi:hypothetical protein